MKALASEHSTALADRWRWYVYVVGRRLGPIGVVAAALLVALVVADSLVLQPRIETTVDARTTHLRTLAALPEPRMRAGKPGMSLKDVQKLRGSEQAFAALQILKRHNLSRVQATYHYQTEAAGRLARLSIDVVVAGSYANLRAAMREVADQPMARIERVSIERQDVTCSLLDATLRISFLGVDA